MDALEASPTAEEIAAYTNDFAADGDFFASARAKTQKPEQQLGLTEQDLEDSPGEIPDEGSFSEIPSALRLTCHDRTRGATTTAGSSDGKGRREIKGQEEEEERRRRSSRLNRRPSPSPSTQSLPRTRTRVEPPVTQPGPCRCLVAPVPYWWFKGS